MRYGIIFLFLGLIMFAGVGIFESSAAGMATGYAAIGFIVVSAGYLFKRPGVWMKRSDGTINPLGYMLCLPLHLLNWLSLRLAAGSARYPAWHEITPNLWLGRRPFTAEAKTLVAQGEWAVVDLTSEFQETKVLRHGKYLCLPTLDHTAPSRRQVERALEFIATETRGRSVLVHCALGHGRSATIVAAWLLQLGTVASVEEADHFLRQIRSGVRLKSTQRQLLEGFFSHK